MSKQSVKNEKKTVNKGKFSSTNQPKRNGRPKGSKDITTYIDEQTKGKGRDMLVKMGLDILHDPKTSNSDKIRLLQMFYKYLFFETTHNINENTITDQRTDEEIKADIERLSKIDL